ncbi:MAG: outer membrane protein assembly factor BamD [Bacteroidales bacterium]|nr:outer membrane protein assembly factor BamD [Bacteroidales bacterium]
MVLLAASVNVCAAAISSPVLTFSSSYTAVQDNFGQPSNDKKPKKEHTKAVKKVTFETFDQSYEKAMRFYNNKQYLSAASLFEELYPLSIGTPKADTILYLFAHSYYMNADYSMAAFHFRDYVRRYPNSERTEDAFYYCISAIYKTSPDYNLDQSNTEYAIEQIKAFIQAYPNNSHLEECNLMLDNLRLKLARKDLEKLKLYYNTDHYEACQIAAKNFFNEYAYSPLMPEAIYYLVQNNYEYAKRSVEKKKDERYKACLDACLKMQTSYPDCKYMKETEKIEQDVRKQLEKYNNNNQ